MENRLIDIQKKIFFTKLLGLATILFFLIGASNLFAWAANPAGVASLFYALGIAGMVIIIILTNIVEKDFQKFSIDAFKQAHQTPAGQALEKEIQNFLESDILEPKK